MLSTHTLKPQSGARKKAKRLGRGNGSGKGTYSTRGMNGQNSRSGGGVPDWFEGGQTPLFRRMPKLKGFSNARFTQKYSVVNLSDIEKLAKDGTTTISITELHDSGLVSKKTLPVKLLGNGKLTQKVELRVDAASASAQKAIEKAGGTLILPEQTSEEK